MPPAFKYFPLLPTEIRLQIWNEALPADIRPALFPFEKGHGRFYTVRQNDREYRLWSWPGNSQLLGSHVISASHMVITHESRAIMLKWRARQPSWLKLRFVQNKTSACYLRDCNLEHDAMYLPNGRLKEPYHEHLRARYTPIPRIDEAFSGLEQIAISINSIADKRGMMRTLDAILYPFSRIKILLIVINPSVALDEHPPRGTVHSRQWESGDFHYGIWTKRVTENRWTIEKDWQFRAGPGLAESGVRDVVQGLIDWSVHVAAIPPERPMEIRMIEARQRSV